MCDIAVIGRTKNTVFAFALGTGLNIITGKEVAQAGLNSGITLARCVTLFYEPATRNRIGNRCEFRSVMGYAKVYSFTKLVVFIPVTDDGVNRDIGLTIPAVNNR